MMKTTKYFFTPRPGNILRLIPAVFVLIAFATLFYPPDLARAAAPKTSTAPMAEVAPAPAVPFTPDSNYMKDRKALDELQRAAFNLIWEGADPDSGLPYEANFGWDIQPVVSGGGGFGVAAIVVGVDRGWISREQGVARLLKITRFLRDKTPRKELYGAFPHWMDGRTGRSINFGGRDSGGDIVETSFMIQGLIIARAYFNGPGSEETLRSVITELWEDVNWYWYTAGEESGMHWHYTPQYGHSGLKMLGYNEGMLSYVLAMASPTHPISRKAYDYWTSGKGYQPKEIYGYKVDASLPGGGPLFITHYSFIGMDPHRVADAFVPEGYFTRNVKQVLSNRAYCLEAAPAKNQYGPAFWGLTACQIKNGYTAGDPLNDPGTIAPTGPLASMPYTPQYSTLAALYFTGPLREKIWGKYGPYDSISLRDDWVSDRYLAIDQLPIVCMIENYRSGLLWRLFMSDKDVQAGLKAAGLHEPLLAPGFPEAVVTLKADTKKSPPKYTPDAYDMRRHPDSGLYELPYHTTAKGLAAFIFQDADGNLILTRIAVAKKGRNHLAFPQFTNDPRPITVTMLTQAQTFRLPIRLN